MTETLIIVGEILGAIIASVTITNFIYYTKSQIDQKFNEVAQSVTSVQLEGRSATNQVKEDTYQKVDDYKRNLDISLQNVFTRLEEMKATEHANSIQFINLINSIKEDLKNDYTARYNDLHLIINTKADKTDFNQVDAKLDKVAESVTRLETLLQLRENK